MSWEAECSWALSVYWEVIEGLEGEEQDFIGDVKFHEEPVKMLQDRFYMTGVRGSGNIIQAAEFWTWSL